METKRITDLTILESLSDAANVLVEENGEAKRVPANKLGGSGGGVSSWNDLTDKPFVTEGSDTLTWDGNTEGLVSALEVYYKMSDATPTLAELSSGTSVALKTATDESTLDDVASMLFENSGMIMCGEWFFVVPSDNFVLGEGDEAVVIPEKGVYFSKFDDQGTMSWVSSVTVNGYTGFVKETLDPSCLPDVANIPAAWLADLKTALGIA